MRGQALRVAEVDTLKQQFVTFRVQSKRYAVPIEAVAEMTQIHDVHPIAGAPSWILGMMRLRNSVVPVLDLRIRLGFPQLQQEIDALLADLARHRQRHLDAFLAPQPDAVGLERVEDCPLRLAIQAREGDGDPLGGLLSRLRDPDQRLHTLGESRRALEARGEHEAVRLLVSRAENAELREMREAFEGVARDLRSRARQMVVILRGLRENLGIAVDHIDAVASVDADQILPRPLLSLESSQASPDLLVASVVRTPDDTSLVQVLDVGRVFRTSGVEPVEEVARDDADRPLAV